MKSQTKELIVATITLIVCLPLLAVMPTLAEKKGPSKKKLYHMLMDQQLTRRQPSGGHPTLSSTIDPSIDRHAK